MFPIYKNKFQKQKVDCAVGLLQEACETSFAGDGMFVADRNMHFFDNEKFANCLNNLAKAEVYHAMAWRMHTLVWAVENALPIPGDLAEFGTFRGFKMKFLLDYFGHRLSGRSVHLFDTFSGIDEAQMDGAPHGPSEHRKPLLFEYVRSRFSGHPNVKIIRGAAPSSINESKIESLAFLHLDMNSWQAEIGTLDAVWEIMQPGSIVVLDDFGLVQHKRQMEEELEWFATKGQQVLELPTGQGLVIKHA